MSTANPNPDTKRSRRKLKIDRYRAEGLSVTAIAKKLKVSKRTVLRDVKALNEELVLEPAYSEERQENLRLARQLVLRWTGEITEDLERARQGGQRTEETVRPLRGELKKGMPTYDFVNVAKALLGDERAAQLVDERGLVITGATQEFLPDGVASETEEAENAEFQKKFAALKAVEITRRTFGPNWSEVARLHRERLSHLELFARISGLMVERAHITTTTTEERVIEGQIVLPEKASIKQWEALVEAHKQGVGIRTLTPEEVEAAAAQGVKLMEWNPEEGAFVPSKARGK